MRICQNTPGGVEDTWICVLPANHAGHCDLIDAMGMCGENDDCRATRRPALSGSSLFIMDWSEYRTARENAIQHNHK